MSPAHPSLAEPLTQLLGQERAQTLIGMLDGTTAKHLPGVLQQWVDAAEQAIWNSARQHELAPAFQALCAAVDAQLKGARLPRHHIHLVIPVADRPRHLRACLDSLQRLIDSFPYSGRLTLIVADDSADPDKLLEQQAITARAASEQLETRYFGPEQQWALYAALPPETRKSVRNLLDQPTPDRMGHKGASVMRNLTCLWLQQLARQRERALFFFVDSDQEFHADTRHDQPVYAINYFYHIDRLFRECPIDVLTGKVVGDPPVSPAVMAGTLLQDLLAFLDEVAGQSPDVPCDFHQTHVVTGGAVYHDMATSFGFETRHQACRYRCPRPVPDRQPHQLGDTVLAFAHRLGRFFHGEHPTRRTDFVSTPVNVSLVPARTVYTGNYVLTPAALRHCIPFAAQRLRMAGPTLGRLLQSEIGARFVSANLPMLHRRAHSTLGRAEYRPGVAQQQQGVDLSDEYLRQFLGDLMLFSVEQLLAQGYPAQVDGRMLEDAVAARAEQLQKRYADNRAILLRRLAELERRLYQRRDWFASDPRLTQAAAALNAFIAQVRENYADQAAAVRQLADAEYLSEQRWLLVRALLGYPTDRQSWQLALDQISAQPPLG